MLQYSSLYIQVQFDVCAEYISSKKNQVVFFLQTGIAFFQGEVTGASLVLNLEMAVFIR